MRIFDYAKEKEKNKIRFFIHQSKIATDRGLKNVLKILAIEEFDQYLALKKMRKSHQLFLDTEMRSENISLNIGTDKTFSEQELFEKIEKLEKESQQDYLNKASTASDNEQRKAFLKLAAQEKEHYESIKGIIDFLSEPQCFLENAEFSHNEDRLIEE